MDHNKALESLLSPDPIQRSRICATASKFKEEISRNELRIVDLVKSLDPILTNCDHEIRFRGILLLSEVITSFEHSFLSTKEIEVLCEFVCLRLLDHKTMEEPALKSLIYFVECKNKPPGYNNTLLELLKTRTNVQKMDSTNRGLVYEIIRKIIDSKLKEDDNIDGDFLYSFIHIIEGESNPRNMLTCFGLVACVMRKFKNLEPYIDDLFEWLSSYYPIDYTPDTKDGSQGVTVTRDDLVSAIHECFFASQLNAANLQTLLLEKLESTSVSTKIESLNCLTRCYETFPAESIKDYASSLWTAVRTDCLRKRDLVDSNLLMASHKALHSMTKNLSSDRELYFMFVCDLYEELSIAFRKPEMELFDSAMRLIISAARANIIGFNYILGKVIPITINAFKSKEYRPLEPLAFVFDTLHEDHPDSHLSVDLNKAMSDLIVTLIEAPVIEIGAVRLIKSMMSCKIDLDSSLVDRLIERIKKPCRDLTVVDEECLALICLNYSRSSIICNAANSGTSLSSLLDLIQYYRSNIDDLKKGDECKLKFKIYGRIMLLLLDKADEKQLDELDPTRVEEFLVGLRSVLETIPRDEDLVEIAGKLHGILMNKMGDQQVEKLVMHFFSSNYCQKLLLNAEDDTKTSSSLYLPVIRWSFKSLILRNNKFSTPMINLLLNFVVSKKMDVGFALTGARVFRFALTEDQLYQKERGYRLFALYKQKLYVIVSKEIKIRYGQEERTDEERYLLLASLASIVPLVPRAVYKKDFEWLLREILRSLSNLKAPSSDGQFHDGIVDAMFDSLSTIISADESGNLMGMLESLVNLSLGYAKENDKLTIRRLALNCLASIPLVFKESELLPFRQTVVRGLKPSLADRKRVVRQKAAEARLKWILVGQPIGS